MMPSLHDHASACAKVILLGEHSVVHGQPALAAGLPEALQLRAHRLADRSAPLECSIPAWDLEFSLADGATHPVARACGDVISHCDGPLTGWRIEGTTAIVARAGLGSSAAITVGFARLVLGPSAPVEAIVEASMIGERVFHGTPSGIDSEVAARGGLLRFVRGQPPEAVVLGRSLPLVIVPSGVERNTADQVAKVHRAIERWPTIARPIVETLGRIATQGQDELVRGDFARFGELADIAHALLGALGVSSPVLDELCSVARAHGALGAKLTGAGGGGCILAVPAGPSEPLAAVFRARGLQPLCVEVRA